MPIKQKQEESLSMREFMMALRRKSLGKELEPEEEMAIKSKSREIPEMAMLAVPGKGPLSVGRGDPNNKIAHELAQAFRELKRVDAKDAYGVYLSEKSRAANAAWETALKAAEKIKNFVPKFFGSSPSGMDIKAGTSIGKFIQKAKPQASKMNASILKKLKEGGKQAAGEAGGTD